MDAEKSISMIPKTIAFFWQGRKMSWLRYMTLKSFRLLNPDWRMKLYICNNKTKTMENREKITQDYMHFDGEDYFSRVSKLDVEIIGWSHPLHQKLAYSPPHNSDLFQWQWLGEHGGIYSDMDILFVESIDNLYEKIKNYDIVMPYHQDTDDWGYFSIGFIGSSENNYFFKELYEFAKIAIDLKYYQSIGSDCFKRFLNVDVPTWREIRYKYPDRTTYDLPMEIVYPFKWDEDVARFEQCIDYLPPDCVGIHWYAGAPLAQKFNSLLNENNWHEYNNTITYHIKRVLSCVAP